MMSKLTLKQQAFIDAYMGESRGNATDAARRAGYKGSDGTLQSVGAANLLKPVIADAITKRRQALDESRILTIEQIQEMLSGIAVSAVKPADQISALKELAKMQGGYAPIQHELTAQVASTTKVDVSKLSKAALLELAQAKRDV